MNMELKVNQNGIQKLKKIQQKNNILTKKQTGHHLYLKILNMEIPEEAKAAFEKNEVFRKQISNLNNIKGQYNNIILQLNEVERPK